MPRRTLRTQCILPQRCESYPAHSHCQAEDAEHSMAGRTVHNVRSSGSGKLQAMGWLSIIRFTWPEPHFFRSQSELAKETVTLSFFTTAKGGSHGSQRNQKVRTSGLYVSGHFGGVLQPAVRDDGKNTGRGLQMPSLGLRGQNGIRGPRIISEDALAAHPHAVSYATISENPCRHPASLPRRPVRCFRPGLALCSPGGYRREQL